MSIAYATNRQEPRYAVGVEAASHAPASRPATPAGLPPRSRIPLSGMARPQRSLVTLRRAILNRVVVLISASTLTVAAGFMLFGVVPVAEHAAESEFGLAAARVESSLSEVFSPAAAVLAMSHGWIAGKAPPVDSPDIINRLFKPVLAASPSITSVVAGTTSGEGWMLLQRSDGVWQNRLTDIGRWGERHRIVEHFPDGRTTSRWESLTYDARRRPWFVAALALAPGVGVSWSGPYTFFTTGDPGITASTRIRLDDGREFVIGLDIMLRDLSQATMRARVGRNGLSLVVTEDERVLALPARPPDVAEQAWLAKALQPVSALGLPAVSAALSSWRTTDKGAADFIDYMSDGTRWLMTVRPYPLGRQRLWVITLAPAADFAPAWPQLAAALGGTLALLLLAAGVIMQIQARSIARPLEALAEASERMGRLDFTPTPAVSSPIAEIGQLAAAQDAMRDVLQRNQAALSRQASNLRKQIKALQVAEDKINNLAFYDPLTHLPNRRLLIDRLQQALAACARSGHRGALLFIDLDNFKTLNDSLGHDVGDLLLSAVAHRLGVCVREGDTVARFGGDEFVVILEGLSDDTVEAAAQTETVAAKILATLAQPYQLSGHERNSTPSIGITLFTGHRDSIEDLLKRADLAMYQAKAAGRNNLRFFDPAMQAAVSARATMEADLRQAVREGQFLLHYQAQVDGSGRLIAAEALVRWQHPARGLVSPAEFIPLAEETGLILPLGEWVMRSACQQLVAWAAQPGRRDLSVSVNVSARQFRHPDFVAQVLEILGETGADPARLRLELTESLLLHDVEEVIARMSALQARGVEFSLDDFGTGYSSLSYLKRLPFSQLKIDQSFVRDVLTDPNDAAIARTIVALAHSMGLAVMAEGVETEEQREFLARQGCHAYQGYLFGRPGPADALRAPEAVPGSA